MTRTSSPATAGRTFGSSSVVATTATAPESVTMCRSSGAVIRKIAGVTTAPARQMAWYATNTSGQLAIITTTREPAVIPSARSPALARSALAWMAPEAYHVSSKTSEG
jgi:hypothetical protein